jgi:hypothetical protein
MTREAIRNGRYIESSELSHSFQFPTGPNGRKPSRTFAHEGLHSICGDGERLAVYGSIACWLAA